MPEKSEEKDKRKQLASYAKYTGIAFQMIAIILVGVFGGVKLDKFLELKIPAFTVILSMLSVLLAIYYVIKDLLKK